MQLHGGYVFDGVFELLGTLEGEHKRAFQKLIASLSHFELTSNLTEEREYTQEFAVLINILQRGLPTRLNITAAEMLAAKYEEIIIEEHRHKWSFKFNPLFSGERLFYKKLFLALHVIDPRLKSSAVYRAFQASWEKLGSAYEEDFLFQQLPHYLQSDFIVQVVETQRSIQSIAQNYLSKRTVTDAVQNNFSEQRTDFCLENVYTLQNEPGGLVVEIDGPQHDGGHQEYLDTERDHVVARSGWANTVRIKTADFRTRFFGNKLEQVKEFLNQSTYYKNVQQAYKFNFTGNKEARNILEIALSPIAIGRVQRVLLEYIASGKLSKFKEKWRIAVLERDVPCAEIALADLKIQIEAFYALQDKQFPLPPIELSIFSSREFLDSPQHVSGVRHLESWDPSEAFDLVIDISVLQRAGINTALKSSNTNVAIIRSSFHRYTDRVVKSAGFISYPQLASKLDGNEWLVDDKKEKILEVFLQSIFRKKKFRIGQLPIINKALQGKSVIGLLPTGGGKSLTYQLSAFLQPGITLAVDPIRSLMKDQVDGLHRNAIDSCTYINSSLRGEAKSKALAELRHGRSLFVFISPERLQMEDFRTTLAEMSQDGHYFSFCVVDEAHCVSEWGHDFRTAYLRLGENAISYCKTKSGNPVTLFGLTATASFDVLSDVQRELSGNSETNRLDEDAIVQMESTKRHELQFKIEEVSYPTAGIVNEWDLKTRLAQKKQERAIQIVENAPYDIQRFLREKASCFANEEEGAVFGSELEIENFSPAEFYSGTSNGALVFCPHTKGIFGVTDRFKVDPRTGNLVQERTGYADVISQAHPNLKVGFFIGSNSDDDGTREEIEELTMEHQEAFINSRSNFLVATKAFGMGIDKENIRYTVHVNYPGSIESYVQEAGRAGRDRKLAISYLLFNDQTVTINGKKLVPDYEHNLYFHKNSFKGISKELAVLDELLNEIHFPDRTFELENFIYLKLDVDVKLRYWEGGNVKRLYISKSFTEPLGFINLSNINGVPQGSVDSDLSAQVFSTIEEYISEQRPDEPIHLWIQQSDRQVGIREILQNKAIGERFSITVGFRNNGSERLKTITQWLTTVIHPGFSEQKVRHLKESSQDFKGFAEGIAYFYESQTHRALDLEQHCSLRDRQRGLPTGTTLDKFQAYYNGYRDKMDTEKAIYRLSTLGIIDDYTVNFSANTFTLYGTKKKDQKYKEHLGNYLLKYYSKKLCDIKLNKLQICEGKTVIEKCLSFLITFVYDEIESKRLRAIADMREACHIGLKEGNVAFKEHIDLYFNSKYARKGYKFYDEVTRRDIEASLTDLTNQGKSDEDMAIVWKFIEIVEIESGSYIDNVKHLRGATLRLLRTQPENYVFLLLNAFSLYQVAFKDERFLAEAEDLLQKAFSQMSEKENWSEKKLKSTFEKFVGLVLKKNPDLPEWMKRYNLRFDFDLVLISRLINPLQKSRQLLNQLNRILLP